MKNWTKVKTFFILIIFIGTLVHLTSILIAICLEEFGIRHSWAAFLISLSFSIFSTLIFVKKVAGFLKRILVVVTLLIFQFCLAIVVTSPLLLLDYMFESIAPDFIQGDKEFGKNVSSRFNDKYGIDFIKTKDIVHSSYWSIGEEFGYDLIFRAQEGEISKFAPEGISFNSLKTNMENSPFRFSNRQFICGGFSDEIKISNDEVRDLICMEKDFPPSTLIAEKWVREDWTVTSVFFPASKILWISEVEW